MMVRGNSSSLEIVAKTEPHLAVAGMPQICIESNDAARLNDTKNQDDKVKPIKKRRTVCRTQQREGEYVAVSSAETDRTIMSLR